MTSMLNDKKVLVVGRGSGIARAITEAARAAGATVTVASREREELAQAYADDRGVSAESVDLTDDDSIAALAERVGAIDHVVSTASARARGLIGDLDRDAVRPIVRHQGHRAADARPRVPRPDRRRRGAADMTGVSR
jgi:NAD(P)-dependent dehydrogenase (short-subunit alcohol dehydrogenase family)